MFNPRNIRNGNYPVFFKIVEKKYLTDMIQEGHIFFNLLSTYRDMEKNSGCFAIGDKTEASLTRYKQVYLNCNGEYHEIHGENAGYNMSVDANQCVFCCYAVGLNSFEMDEKQCYHYKIPCDSIAKICKDKGGVENCAIIIFNSSVIGKVLNKLQEEKLSYRSGFLSYDDYQYIPQNKTNSLEYALECCFHKESRFDYQNEFRIATINKEKKPLEDIFIIVDDEDFVVEELKEQCDLLCSIIIAEEVELPNNQLNVEMTTELVDVVKP